MKIFGYKPSEVRKFLVGVLSFALTLIAILLEGDLLPKSWIPWVVVVIAVSGSYGIYRAPNAPSSSTAP